MRKNFYRITGLLIFIIPFMGIPIVWRNYIISFLGLTVFVYAVWPFIAEKLNKLKQKPKRSPAEIKKKVELPE